MGADVIGPTCWRMAAPLHILNALQASQAALLKLTTITFNFTYKRCAWRGTEHLMKPKRQAAQARRELVKISEFQRRVWGENGTPLCSQAIRNQIRNDSLPGERVGKLWFIDWTSYQNATGNDLVDSVLRGAA
jgi:hypothetical protein